MTHRFSWWVFLLCIGIGIRVLSVSYALSYRENTDILRWKDWGRITYLHSLADTYKPDFLSFGTLPNNMPPGTLYLASGMYRITILVSKVVLRITHESAGDNMFLNSSLPTIFLRLPSMLFDIFIAILIYVLLKKSRGKPIATLSSMLFFLNPLTIYNSAIWGQMDSITTGFMLFAFVLMYQKKYTRSILMAAGSLFIKLSLLFLFPILIVTSAIRSKSIQMMFRSLVVALSMILLSILPLSSNPVSWMYEYLSKHATGEMQHITAFAFNLWWFFFAPVMSIVSNTSVFDFSEIRLTGSPLVSQIYFGIPLWIYAVSLFIFSLLPFITLWFSRREKLCEPRKLFLISALVSLLVFLMLPQMHERYMYPVFPFLALAIGLGEPFLIEFVSLAFLHLLNLIFVWHPMKEMLPLYSPMNSPLIQWGISALIVCVSFSIYWKSYFRLKHS